METYKIKDLGQVITGKTPPTKSKEYFDKESYDFITPTDITDERFIVNTNRKISELGYEKFSKKFVSPFSVGVTCIGSDMGKVFMNRGLAMFNQQINFITNFDNIKVNHFYLYYNLRLKREFFRNLAMSGSTMPNMNKTTFENIEVTLPSIEEQKKISSILSSLDDKIELNNKMNETLEEMAQTIFKEWFVNFNFPNEEGKPYKDNGGKMVESELGMIPEGWKIEELRKISEKISKGTTPKKKDLIVAMDSNKVYFLKVKNLKDNGEFLINNLELIPNSINENQLKRSILKEKDILFSIAGTIGRIAIISKKFNNSNCNQALAFIRLENIDKYLTFVYYFLKQETIKAFINSKVVQGVQSNISLKTLSELMLVIPNNIVMKNWNKIATPLFNEILKFQEEKETLIKTRDILLPKLMSGELRV